MLLTHSQKWFLFPSVQSNWDFRPPVTQLNAFSSPLPLVAAGFDLMAFFNVRQILGTREEDGQSSYVRLGTVPIVQQTEWLIFDCWTR